MIERRHLRVLLAGGVASLLAASLIDCTMSFENFQIGQDVDAGVDGSIADGADAPPFDVARYGTEDAGEDVEGDASQDVDASEDAGVDAAQDADADAPVDVACTPPQVLCPPSGSCVVDCTSCPGLPIECFDCTTNPRRGVCSTSGSPCATHCGCDAATDCPGAVQVCVGRVCFACGEGDAATSGVRCEDGKTCRVNPFPPTCR